MENGFNVVAIRIEHESGVIARVIRPLSRCAVVLAAACQRGLVKAIYHGAVARLEGKMVAPGEYAIYVVSSDGGETAVCPTHQGVIVP